MKGFDLMAILLNAQFGSMLVHGIMMTFIIFICSWTLAMSLGVLLLTLRMLSRRIAEPIVAAGAHGALPQSAKLHGGLQRRREEALARHGLGQERNGESQEDSEDRQGDQRLDQRETPRGTRRRCRARPDALRAPRGKHLISPTKG